MPVLFLPTRLVIPKYPSRQSEGEMRICVHKSVCVYAAKGKYSDGAGPRREQSERQQVRLKQGKRLKLHST